MLAVLPGSTLLLVIMHPAITTFNQLLEQYIFKVASHQIGSAEPATQTDILALWQTVNDTVPGDESVTTSSVSQLTEWDCVLQKPVNWRSVNQQWLQLVIRERSQQHMAYLIRLKQAIVTTHFHLQAVQNSPLPARVQTRLSAHYQHTLHMYQHQLAQAEHLQDTYFAKLAPNSQ